MKIFTFFNKHAIGTVPGGSSLGAICKYDGEPFTMKSSRRLAAKLGVEKPLDVAVNHKPAPLVVTQLSRVVYRVYDDDKAVVFAGIDHSMSTQGWEHFIIAKICELEKLEPRSAWTFHNLLTALHSRRVHDGSSEYVRVLLQPEGEIPKVIGLLPIDCPEIVLCDFDDFICRLTDPQDPAFPPFEYDHSGDEDAIEEGEDD